MENKNRYGALDLVRSPDDLRTMSVEVKQTLCANIREFLIDHVSRTGGHLASNLGIVELTVALESEFDSRRDRIIYDVGHQCYVHKMLTGRKAQFDTLRTYGGLSGFLKPSESETDPCITGHASSSVSVALGMAHARTLKNDKYHVVAVIGDGALTGGMAYEALSDAGASQEPLLVILNDNNMSIDKNVGGMARHLARLRVSPQYLGTKNRIKNMLSHIPGGKSLTAKGTKLKSAIKSVLLPGSMFEQMGFTYLGPVDGHDLPALSFHLQLAKRLRGPVLLHVMTKKGKGYPFAEQAPDRFHGVSKFDPATGVLPQSEGDFSAVFGAELTKLARCDERICAITAAMPSGTGLSGFAQQFPQRFFDVGIAEEHAVAMTAGMAKQGLRAVCAIYATFLQRAYDQLIHDVSVAGDIPAVFAVDRAGIVGADGATHNGTFDIPFLRTIPNMTILCPANYAELRTMLTQALYHNEAGGAVAIRYPRGKEGTFTADTAAQPICCVRPAEQPAATILTYGILVNEAMTAAALLEQQGIAVSIWKVNEISSRTEQTLDTLLEQLAPVTVVLEDVVQNGSFSEAVCRAADAHCKEMQLLCINTGNRFLPHGSPAQIYQLCGMDGASVAHLLSKYLT
ncbi:MAG: 1-deoxy-D-xylulose-5-phosphate synthase [Butyricicoccus pullicaecorum]|nr:1-deoxy-D-xylulose-5-phosphate synthase [Butyricicoccus pullicaecorum]